MNRLKFSKDQGSYFYKELTSSFPKKLLRDSVKRKKDWRYHGSFWLQKVFYLSYLMVLPILFSNQPWIIVITGFILMHLIQSLFLLLTFFMTHHVEKTEYPTTDENGFIRTSWLMNQVKAPMICILLAKRLILFLEALTIMWLIICFRTTIIFTTRN